MAKQKLEYTYEIYIGAPVAQVWRGLVDGEMTRQYVYGTRLDTELRPGAPYAYLGEADFKVVDGEIVEVDPERTLVMTWRAHWDASVSEDRASRVRYEISPAGASATKLKVIHNDFDRETATYKSSTEGWPLMLSSLKTLIECGKGLAVG
jgi:uncharacterized protein YndB with AHSA1/START domain